jgi:hypothetical protein
MADPRRALAVVYAALAAAAVGQTMLLVALNVAILNRTHSAPAVAGLWVVPLLATMATGTLAGRYVDRWDSRRVLVLTNVSAGVVALSIAWLNAVWDIYLAFAVFAVLDNAFRTAFAPYFTRLVPAVHRPRANAIRGGLTYGALVLGPALAGAILLASRPAAVIEVVGGALILSGGLMAVAPRCAVRDRSDAPAAGGIWADLGAVAAFFRARRGITAVMALFQLVVALASAADAEEVVFVHRALHLGASGYALLVSTAGVGYLVGAGIAWVVARRTATRWLVSVGLTGATLGYLTYALSHAYAPAAAGLLALGAAMAIASTGFSTFVQWALPMDKMGRILGAVRSAASAATVATTLLGSVAVAEDGVRAMMVSACGLAVLAALGMVAVAASTAGQRVFAVAVNS